MENLSGKSTKTSPSNLYVNGVNLHFATVGTIIQESIQENDSDNFLDYIPYIYNIHIYIYTYTVYTIPLYHTLFSLKLIIYILYVLILNP